MTLALLSILTLSIAGGCSDDFTGAEVVCRKGDTRECLGPGACKGAQECTATGSGFQPCQCGDSANQGGGGQGANPADLGAGANSGGRASTTTGGTSSAGGSGDSTVGGEATVGGGTGVGGTGGIEGDCSPIGNVGCSRDQNCALDVDRSTCVNAGTKAELSACELTSECAPGLFCQLNNCVKGCGAPSDCTAADPSRQCGIGISRPDLGIPVLGSCVRPCDVLTQDCPAGQACYIGSCLAPIAAGGPDKECISPTQCAKGLDCLTDLDGDTAPDCSRYCSTTAQNPCGQGFTCHPLEEAFPSLPATWGICIITGT
jgi:hypothetical protein